MSAPVILSAAATKGGVGKTTLIANVSAVLADIGLRVLMIDCDVQPSLSKYYPISHRAPNGIVELLLGGKYRRNHPLDNFQYRFSEFRHCYFQ
ncbi:TPA: ParA family protein [Neisseria gonorrhoeae]